MCCGVIKESSAYVERRGWYGRDGPLALYVKGGRVGEFLPAKSWLIDLQRQFRQGPGSLPIHSAQEAIETHLGMRGAK